MLRKELKNGFIIFRANFSETEIEMFFSRYDVDGNTMLDHREAKKASEDIGLKKADTKKEDEPQSRPGAPSKAI